MLDSAPPMIGEQIGLRDAEIDRLIEAERKIVMDIADQRDTIERLRSDNATLRAENEAYRHHFAAIGEIADNALLGEKP